MIRINSLFIALVLLFSCKKAEDRECLKAAGSETNLTIALANFNKIRVGAKIEVVLVQDTENKMIISGRDNLIKHISYDIDDEGFLVLHNNNRCDFLRSNKKNKLKVELHFIDIEELFFEGTFDLTTTGIINLPHPFRLSTQDGGATVHLAINCTDLNVYQGHGYGDFIIKGNSQNTFVKIISNGFGDAKELKTANNLYWISDTPVSSQVNIDGANATIEIDGSGNVTYVGTPLSLNHVQYGTGELIDGN